MPSSFDLVIRNGNVADGRGGPLYQADVAVNDGVIAKVGKIAASGKTEIDAKGKLVTPGLVDIHTHYDGQAAWDARLTPSSWHGVTTIVMGNCGVGFAPVRKSDHERIVELMEGVEDIPGSAIHEGLSWDWESFGEYLDALERRPHDIDIGTQLPHGALRVFVMGERGAKLERATDDDIAEMRRLSRDAMREGALGFSTSRTLNHRTVKGDPTPSLRASEEELTGIAMGMRDAGSGVVEFISDFNTPDAETEFAMIRRIVAASGRPLSLSLAQAHSKPNAFREILRMIDTAASDGLDVRAQVAPRPIGLILGLQASLNPFSTNKVYRTIANEPLEKRLAAMRDADFRRRVFEEGVDSRPNEMVRRLTSFDRIFPLGNPPDYEPAHEHSIAGIAARLGRNPAEIAYDALLENEGRNFLLAPIANYADFNLDACREMIAHPRTLMGLGDGGAHVGLISDASFITYLLSYWGRDRSHGRFDIGWLIKRQTLDNAAAVGLRDRGVIAAGMKADLNVIDFDKLGIDAPVMAFDLPAGGKRLLQRARGYNATIVSGVPVYYDGEPTGELPGRVIRGPQSVPATQP